MNGDEAAKAQADYAPLPASAGCEGLPVRCGPTVIDGNQDMFPKQISGTSNNPKDIAARSRCPLHLIPPVAEGEIAWVLSDGAEKYGRYNWRDEKISLLNYLGAMKRHIAKILDGEDSDTESGLLHLAHVAATACIVMDAMSHDCVIDDRPK
jgi:hypothetical protein